MSGHGDDERPTEKRYSTKSAISLFVTEMEVAIRAEDWKLVMRWADTIHDFAKRMTLKRMGCVIPVE